MLKCAELVKRLMELVMKCEVETVSSPLTYQEEVPQMFYERYMKDDIENNN